MLIKTLQKHIFIYFLLLWVCYILSCCALSTNNQETVKRSVQLFKEETVCATKSKVPLNSEEKISVKKIKTFFLIAGNGLMMALIEAEQNSDGSGNKVNLLAKYFVTVEEKWGDEAIQQIDNKEKWKVQLVAENNPLNDKYFVGVTSVAYEKKKEIYVFALKKTTTGSDSEDSLYKNVDLILFVGTISDEPTKSSGKTISWEKKLSSKFLDVVKNKQDFETKVSELLITDISAFVKSDGIVVLLLKNKKDGNEKVANIYVSVNDSKDKFELLHVETVENCNPHFFQWGDKIIMILTDYADDVCNSVKVMESTDMMEWVNITGPFSRLLGFLKNKRDFTSALINDYEVLLFTQQESKESTSRNDNKYDYSLFISDGTRVKNIGLVAKDVETVDPIRLLFTSNELFTLHKNKKSDDYQNIILTCQKELLTTIQLVVDSWKNANNVIQAQCTGSSDTSSLCINELPKDGVVGFLSNNASKTDNNEIWHDEYYYVNATVEKADKTDNGFRFDKPGAKAVWLVKDSKENTPYSFADLGFTLVATVRINKQLEPNQKRPVLGVTHDKNKKGISVVCLEESMFAVNSNENTITDEVQNKKCVVGEQYQVALVYNDSKLVVYVDWDTLGKKYDFKINEGPEENSLQFYFGAVSNEESEATAVSHVTVTNVLLYNRPFTKEEILALKSKHDERISKKSNDDIRATQQGNEDDDNSALQLPSEDSEEPASFSDTLTTQTNTATNEGEVQSSLHPRESAASVNINVGVLFLIFFIVFTLSEHYP